MNIPVTPNRMKSTSEWLETDGRGGYASGTMSGIRTRRYHGLLVVAKANSSERFLLVNGFDASIQTPSGHYFLNSQWYAPGVMDHVSEHRIESFRFDPWPHWTFELEDGTRLEQQLFYHRDNELLCLSWRLLSSTSEAKLFLRPLISGRSYHSLHEENATINLDAAIAGKYTQWHPYPALPVIYSGSNGDYVHEPLWYRHFIYQQEIERGLDAREDLASPGLYHFDLTNSKAIWMLSTKSMEALGHPCDKLLQELSQTEQKRRQKLSGRLRQSADHYIVKLGKRDTIIAGYPWFTDWGRYTFISLRGLCLSSNRLAEAHSILNSWCQHISEGMLPNYFPEKKDTPEYDCVDSSLWLVTAIYDFLRKAEKLEPSLYETTKSDYQQAIGHIVGFYAKGTRYGIGMDTDGLLKCGERGTALTWMNARLEENPVTPRVGKPVEVQALWINALKILTTFNKKWEIIAERATNSFNARFWNEENQCLFDVIDCLHLAHANDDSIRPNQVFAIGGLPFQILDSEKSKLVVQKLEEHLLTPYGLRTLSPVDPHYRGQYHGNVFERDQAYHQGTVWTWLMGPFIEAWVRSRNNTASAKMDAEQNFLMPVLQYVQNDGFGHLSELTDAETPFDFKGCPFHASALAEILRIREFLKRD